MAAASWVNPGGLLCRPLQLRPKALALLVYLALSEEPQPRSGVAELFFPEATNPRDSLRWYLSYLRRRMPDALVLDRISASAWAGCGHISPTASCTASPRFGG